MIVIIRTGISDKMIISFPNRTQISETIQNIDAAGAYQINVSGGERTGPMNMITNIIVITEADLQGEELLITNVIKVIIISRQNITAERMGAALNKAGGWW